MSAERDPEVLALDARILALIARGEGGPRVDGEFEGLARDLFGHQYQHNVPYRRLCDADGVSPDTLRRIEDIPACPTEAFKRYELVTFPPTGAALAFVSSGTTGEARSRHVLDTSALYDAALFASYRHFVQPDRDRLRLLLLFPTFADAPGSSLGYMLDHVRARLGTPDSARGVVVGRLDVDGTLAELRRAARDGAPLVVLGTAFSFVHLLDAMAERDARVALPPGSRVMETGGYKGRSREVPRDALYGAIATRLGVAPAMIVNEYGMTEMGSQFYDGTLRAALGCPGRPDRVKRPPPWVRSWVVEPSDPTREVSDGATGVLKHLDLVNRGSVCCLLTGDRARRVGDGFEVLGRAAGAELRGCSLALERLGRL